jgi:hypothetical protein
VRIAGTFAIGKSLAGFLHVIFERFRILGRLSLERLRASVATMVITLAVYNGKRTLGTDFESLAAEYAYGILIAIFIGGVNIGKFRRHVRL